ncbi:hypothetical protein Tco_0607447, partial [Tanacetum coccineum]
KVIYIGSYNLIAQAMQKKEEEKRIAEEQAAKERYWNDSSDIVYIKY